MIGNKAWYIAACRHQQGEQLIRDSNGVSNRVRRERIVLPAMSPGTERSLHVLRFGAEGVRPKAYFQASLHADELPAMLVLNHLIERLARPGKLLCKVAGKESLPDRHAGALLTD